MDRIKKRLQYLNKKDEELWKELEEAASCHDMRKAQKNFGLLRTNMSKKEELKELDRQFDKERKYKKKHYRDVNRNVDGKSSGKDYAKSSEKQKTNSKSDLRLPS